MPAGKKAAASSKHLGCFRQDGYVSLCTLVYDRHDSGRGVAFQPVVHINVSGSSGLASPFDQLAQGGASFGVRILDLSIRRELPHCLLIFTPPPGQRPADQEIARERLRDGDLLAQLRHPRPRIEYVRNSVRAQAIEVFTLEELFVA